MTRWRGVQFDGPAPHRGVNIMFVGMNHVDLAITRYALKQRREDGAP